MCVCVCARTHACIHARTNSSRESQRDLSSHFGNNSDARGSPREDGEMGEQGGEAEERAVMRGMKREGRENQSHFPRTQVSTTGKMVSH